MLVDDHAVVREGYRRLLQRAGGIEVIAEAASSEAALAVLGRLRPAVLVMDLSLPDGSGIQTLRLAMQLQPGLNAVVSSMHEDAIFAARSLEAGAIAYVTKRSAAQELVQAVQLAARGERYLSADIAQLLALRTVNAGTGGRTQLSGRELEIVRLLAQGYTVKEIAHLMGIQPKTVANHQSTARQKLGASTAVRLLGTARTLGFVDP